MSHRFLALAVGLAAIALPAVSLASTAKTDQQAFIKIGSISILTGPTSVVGIETVRGAAFQLKRINAQGGVLGGRKLQIVSADDANNPQVAAQQAQKLVQDEKVVGIIGPINSVSALAIQRTVNDAKIPNVIYQGSAEEITAAKSPYVFRSCNTLTASYNALGTYLYKAKRHRKFAYIGWNLAAGTSSLRGLNVAMARNAGAELVFSQQLPLLTQDFSGAISQARSNNPDVVIIGAPMPFAGVLVRQIRQAGWNVAIGHFGGFVVTDFGQFLGNLADGIIMSDNAHWRMASTRKLGQQFIAAFEKAFKRTPTASELVGAESMNIMAQAIRKAGTTNGEKVAQALHSMNYNGIRYSARWSAAGNMTHAPIAAVIWRKGGTELGMLQRDIFPIVRKKK